MAGAGAWTTSNSGCSPVVDVSVERVIGREPAAVAAFAIDPGNAPEWYENIKAVEWEPPLAVGSELGFVAQFLGRRLEYTYVVREFVPGERLVVQLPLIDDEAVVRRQGVDQPLVLAQEASR